MGLADCWILTPLLSGPHFVPGAYLRRLALGDVEVLMVVVGERICSLQEMKLVIVRVDIFVDGPWGE